VLEWHDQSILGRKDVYARTLADFNSHTIGQLCRFRYFIVRFPPYRLARISMWQQDWRGGPKTATISRQRRVCEITLQTDENNSATRRANFHLVLN
jgi:hypothetical protein